MSTIKVNSIEPANAGSEDYVLPRAWVNFNGTGTVAIRDSVNISSLTDNAVGDWTVTLSITMSDSNYMSFGSVGDATLDHMRSVMTNAGLLNTSTAIRVNVENHTSDLIDAEYVGASAIGGLV